MKGFSGRQCTALMSSSKRAVSRAATVVLFRALPLTVGRAGDGEATLRGADFAAVFRGVDRDAGFFAEPARDVLVFRFDAMTPSPPNSPDPAHAI